MTRRRDFVLRSRRRQSEIRVAVRSLEAALSRRIKQSLNERRKTDKCHFAPMDVEDDAVFEHLVSRCKGLGLLLASLAGGGFSLYSIYFSKILPEPENMVLEAVRSDRYYCLLVPLLVPVSVMFIFFNWLGMKYYRHN